MTAEYKKHLDTLEKNDPHFLGLNWKNSAAYFKEEAKSGKVISIAVDALKNVFHESQQVPVMDEVSAALIYHSINSGDFKQLQSLIQNTSYPDFIFSVFLKISEKTENIESAVPFLLSSYSQNKKNALLILRKIIEKCKDRENLISVCADFFLRKKKLLLPEFLHSLAAGRININSAVHNLNSFFHSEKEISILEKSLTAMAESGADLSPLEENILILLKIGTAKNKRIFSLCICVHYIFSGQKEKLEKLISDKSSDIRFGACNSVIFSFYKRSYNAYHLEKIFLFLSDPEQEIRRLALNRLKIIEKENPECILNEDLIKEYICIRPEISSELFDFLCIYAGKNVSNAKCILEQSFLIEHRDREKLAETCRQMISGNETCRICLAIPRKKLYYWDFDVPKEVLKLLPEMDFTEETAGCRRVCPVCGRRYHYRFITEYEDMTSSTEIIIEKLPPQLSESPEEKEYLDRFLMTLNREISHSMETVREKASFDLSIYYYHTQDNEKLYSLLNNFQDISLQWGAIQGISGREYSEELASAAAELLNSPDSRLRSNTAAELARHYMQTYNINRITDLLSSSDQTFTVSPAIQKVYFINREKKNNLDILYPIFLNLLNSSDETVRRFSDYFLAEMNLAEDSIQKIILNRLNHRNPEIRKEAALSIERKASKDFDPSFAFRPLVRLLKNKTTAWAAVSVFKKCAYLDYNLNWIIPFLIRQIKNEKKGGREDAAWTLSIIQEKRGFPEKFLKSLSPLLSFRECNISYMVYNIFDVLQKQGKDISFAEKHIRKFFQSRKERDSLKEKSVYLLTDIYIQNKDIAKLKIMILHKSQSVRYASSSRIYDSMQKGKDISFCTELIRENIHHNYEFLREVSLKILG